MTKEVELSVEDLEKSELAFFETCKTEAQAIEESRKALETKLAENQPRTAIGLKALQEVRGILAQPVRSAVLAAREARLANRT